MKKHAISMMSGTSLDGIDIIYGDIEGSGLSTKLSVHHTKTYAYDHKLMEKIKKAMSQSESTSKLLCSLNVELAQAYSKCVFAFCEEFDIDMTDIDFIANHGQTIYHISEDDEKDIRSSLQLGDGSVLAQLTKIQVVSNFRMADIASGGHGAPLVPYAHYVLFRDQYKDRILQNIGGIANATYLMKDRQLEDVLAFDNGPGNMMIDYACQTLLGKDYDDGGHIASSGQVIQAMFDDVMAHPYFKKKPPKSTGREVFGQDYCDQLLKTYNDEDPKDIITTLTHITAKAIGQSYMDFIKEDLSKTEMIVSGGGARNKTLINLIKLYAKTDQVYVMEDFGYDSDYFEALAFMILANQTLLGQTSNVPHATGAKEDVVLGQISPVRGG